MLLRIKCKSFAHKERIRKTLKILGYLGGEGDRNLRRYWYRQGANTYIIEPAIKRYVAAFEYSSVEPTPVDIIADS
jgi:hypothetical protein